MLHAAAEAPAPIELGAAMEETAPEEPCEDDAPIVVDGPLGADSGAAAESEASSFANSQLIGHAAQQPAVAEQQPHPSQIHDPFNLTQAMLPSSSQQVHSDPVCSTVVCKALMP